MQTYQIVIAYSFIGTAVIAALVAWYTGRRTIELAAGALALVGLVAVTAVGQADPGSGNNVENILANDDKPSCGRCIYAGHCNHVDLRTCDFGEYRLASRDFSNSQLQGANFFGCTVQGFNFTNADLRNVVFTAANMGNVDFSGADVTGVQWAGGYYGGYAGINKCDSETKGLPSSAPCRYDADGNGTFIVQMS